MKKQALFLLSLSFLLASCGLNASSSSSDSIEESPVSSESLPSSESVDSSLSSDEPFYPSIPGTPEMDDEAEHDAGGLSELDVREALLEAYESKKTLRSNVVRSQVYLRGNTEGYGVELTETHYDFYESPTYGTIMTGRAEYRKGSGVYSPVIDQDSGYGYHIQSYVDGGYLHYLEKADEGVTSRVSYDNVSKNNRYNNLYTIYSANRDLAIMEDVLDAIDKQYGSASETARYIDTIGDSIIFKITTHEYSPYTYYNYDDFFYVHLDKTTKKVTRVDSGFLVYDLGGDLKNEEAIQAMRIDSVSQFDYEKRPEFQGTLYNENDVEKVYGLAPQHKVDYSSWEDGVLSTDRSVEILQNLQTFAEGTTSSTATFHYGGFVDPQSQADEDSGEYAILGEASGTATTTLYEGDFAEIQGQISLVNKEGTKEISMVSQTIADDEGMRIATAYSDVLKSHKHVFKASEVSDTDPYLGISPIYRPEVFHPFEIAAGCGLNCDKNSPINDDSNTYTSAGALSKSGNVITGKLTKVYHKNVWTPYWTYSASFTIEDGFLSSITLDVSTYRESDTAHYEFDSSFAFAMKKGEPVLPFSGDILDVSSLKEGSVMAKNEWIYM
ncbi:MAG: hypothetical protein SOV58_04165 [Candidatus Enteromonas sp.]|nr:hypothetical protein [Candidatus Enteromonas sp.]